MKGDVKNSCVYFSFSAFFCWSWCILGWHWGKEEASFRKRLKAAGRLPADVKTHRFQCAKVNSAALKFPLCSLSFKRASLISLEPWLTEKAEYMDTRICSGTLVYKNNLFWKQDLGCVVRMGPPMNTTVSIGLLYFVFCKRPKRELAKTASSS